MVFSSLEFLLWFLPFFFLIYFLLPPRRRNACLFCFSLAFYIYGVLDTVLRATGGRVFSSLWQRLLSQPLLLSHVFLLLGCVLVCWLFGRMIGRGHHSRLWLTLSLVLLLGNLFVFKYAGFFGDILRGVFPDLPVWQPVLPIGISFYTFQAVSYLADVYRGRFPAEKKPLYVGVYLIMFPQLIAGPIVRYSDVRTAMAHRRVTRRGVLGGAELFVLGLGAKVLLANRLGGLWAAVGGIGYESISTPLAWLGIAAFSLQLYFDFYGYSLMAMGLGRILGFRLPHNFRLPYTAVSMTDFWRRWHITLGSWFKSYVYIPLGGSRRGRARTILNLLIVWCLTGLWHGASWNFLLWGLTLFVILAAEKLGLVRLLERRRWLGHLYMLVLIPLTWLIFAVTDLPGLGIYLGRLFGIGGVSVFRGDFIKYFSQYGVFLAVGLALSLGAGQWLYLRVRKGWFRLAVAAAILAGSLYCIFMGMNDPFLYFRF